MCTSSMDLVAQSLIDGEADKLSEDIVKFFCKYKINLAIPGWSYENHRFIFKIKLKGNTREPHVRARAKDVQDRLKLPLFYVVKIDFTLYIITSRKKIEYEHLSSLLHRPESQEALGRVELPCLVGYDPFGSIVMDDLAQFPHLLLGGSTNSGKSVGLQALITTISYSKSPSKVNLILIDVGANDLVPFEGLPHLSCSVVRERTAAIQTLAALASEMERRIDLEYACPDSLKQLPRLVLVIDEFPALFTGADKTEVKQVTDVLSNLLQRGRHAKIHLVLAAQNPTIQNMKVDLGNITARVAFKCAKKNFSETILGEGGAETLMGRGDLLIRSPRFDSPLRVQGIYITPAELQQAIQEIKEHYCNDASSMKFNLALPIGGLVESSSTLADDLTCSAVRKRPSDADRLLAEVIVWALERNSISINMLMSEFQLGWNKASRLVKRLEELGIVDRPEGKLPRNVIPNFPGDIPEDLMRFIEKAGYTEYDICSAIYSR